MASNKTLDSIKTSAIRSVHQLQSAWNELSWKQQVAIASIGSCAVAISLLKMKRQRDFENAMHQLKEQGYHETDAITSIMAGYTRLNKAVSIDGFQTCNDSFTFAHCLQFWTNIAEQHICFRSILQYRLKTYFWIECCKANKMNRSNENKIDLNDENGNIQLNSQLKRSDFYEKYGFDIMKRIKL